MQPTRFWQASWIWPRDRREPNLHLLFRKDFASTRPLRAARLVVAAESSAQVVLNGVELGRTAANAYPGLHYYETYDALPALCQGANRLALVVRYIGIPSSASLPQDPGLLCELELEDASGAITRIGSDATWLCCELPAWLGRQRRSEWLNLDQVEIVDHRLLPAGFPDVTDLTGFAAPEALPWPGVRCTGLVQRPFAKPADAGDARLTLLRAGTLTDLSAAHPIPAIAMSHEEIAAQPFAWDGGPCIIPAQPDGRAFALLFAFDSYWNGRAVLEVDAPDGAVVDIAWHEQLADGRFDVRGVKVYSADRHILAAGRCRIAPEDWMCGRFLQLTFRNLRAPLTVHGLRFRREEYPLRQRLRFRSSDPRLERIVAISLQAVRRCMHDNIMDCPWRERRQWIGDVQRIALISHLAFAERDLVRAVLRQHVQLQDPSGRMWVCAPIWEEFPPQSMEWLRAVLEYQQATGDRTLLDEVRDNAEMLHRWFLRQRDAQGLLFIAVPPVQNWMDNPFSRLRAHQYSTAFLAQNLRYLLFLDDIVEVFRQAGRAADAAQAQAERSALAGRIRTAFADPASGLLRDCARADLPLTVSELGHALAVVSGVVEGAEALALWRRFEAFRRQRPAEVIPVSPFGAYQVHVALQRLGLEDELMGHVLEHWGPMVEAGAETTWEHLPGEGAGALRSQCHGWAGIPVLTLVSMLLGLSGPGRARREGLGGVAWIEAEIDIAGG
jgi:hypothetical protein